MVNACCAQRSHNLFCKLIAVVISDFSPRKNRFNFHVAVSYPLTGLTIRYGWLAGWLAGWSEP
jgi:hypothetical protein